MSIVNAVEKNLQEKKGSMDSVPSVSDWGVHKHGAVLHINEPIILNLKLPIVVDIETDEKDNFVGMGLTQDGKNVFYVTSYLRFNMFKGAKLIGHNLKFDAKKLVYKGFQVTPEALYADTALMSYTINATKESHSLKTLGKELGFEWPTYKEMVGSGRKKQTLDKQPVERVANYCAMDVLVTYKLFEHFSRLMNVNQKRLYSQIELPLMKILFEMELKGVQLDISKLEETNSDFERRLTTLKSTLNGLAGREINPNSTRQVAEVIQARGKVLPTTAKGNFKVDKFTLEQFQDDEFVKTLSDYNKLETLYSMFTQSLLAKKTLPKVYTTYNQLVTGNNDLQGINTGRLSSKEPNLQQIPVRGEGLKLREIFIPKAGYTLLDADYSQIEYRLLAHFTKEPILLEAFRNGKDIHEETGRILGVNRDIGKTLNFASIYGAQGKKIARTAKISEEDGEKFLKRYWESLPYVTAWINRIKYEARLNGGVFTLMKRWIPLPGIRSLNKYERMHWERAAVNYTIQGSAAEIIKLAMIELRKKGYLPLLTVHDELLFETEDSQIAKNIAKVEIKETMEFVVKLDVPLVADVGMGGNWREAKE